MRAPTAATVGSRPAKAQGQPVVAVARVLEEGVCVPVAREGAAQFDEHVLVAVVVEVGEGDAVALLEMAGARSTSVTSSKRCPARCGTSRSG